MGAEGQSLESNDLAPTRDTPSIAIDFVGVQVAISPGSTKRGPLTLLGVFQLPEAQADTIDVHPHRGLVVAFAFREGTVVRSPFRARLFFPDDVQRKGGIARGYFRVQLVEPGKPVPEGPCWITVSLGVHLSNVVGFGNTRPFESPPNAPDLP
jgi:hypothetical protein